MSTERRLRYEKAARRLITAWILRRRRNWSVFWDFFTSRVLSLVNQFRRIGDIICMSQVRTEEAGGVCPKTGCDYPFVTWNLVRNAGEEHRDTSFIPVGMSLNTCGSQKHAWSNVPRCFKNNIKKKEFFVFFGQTLWMLSKNAKKKERRGYDVERGVIFVVRIVLHLICFSTQKTCICSMAKSKTPTRSDLQNRN